MQNDFSRYVTQRSGIACEFSKPDLYTLTTGGMSAYFVCTKKERAAFEQSYARAVLPAISKIAKRMNLRAGQ